MVIAKELRPFDGLGQRVGIEIDRLDNELTPGLHARRLRGDVEGLNRLPKLRDAAGRGLRVARDLADCAEATTLHFPDGSIPP